MSLKIGNTNIGLVVKNEGTGIINEDVAPVIFAETDVLKNGEVTITDGLENGEITSIDFDLPLTKKGKGEPSTTNIRDIAIVKSPNLELYHNDGTLENETVYQLPFPGSPQYVTQCRFSVNENGGDMTVTQRLGFIEFDGVTEGKKVTYSNTWIYIDVPDCVDLRIAVDGESSVGQANQSSAIEYGLACNMAITSGRGDSASGNKTKIVSYHSSNGPQIRIQLDPSLEITTTAEANTFLKNLYDNHTPLTVVYPLVEPQTFTRELTSEEVSTLMAIKTFKGKNKFRTNFNAGNLLLNYRADTTLAVKNIVRSRVPFRVCSFNIHQFDQENSTGAAFDQDVILQTRKFINDYSPDFMGICEDRAKFGTLALNPDEEIFEPYFAFRYTTGDNAMKSNYYIKDFKTYGPSGHFPTQTLSLNPKATTYGTLIYQGYVCSGRINVYGRDILMVVSHMTSAADEAAYSSIRQQQYADLINIIQGEEYVIVMGDWNAGTGSGRMGLEPQEYANLTNLGYVAANCGYLGLIKTDNENARALDNIIVTPNIKIDRLQVISSYGTHSDHKALVVDLKID